MYIIFVVIRFFSFAYINNIEGKNFFLIVLSKIALCSQEFFFNLFWPIQLSNLNIIYNCQERTE